MDLKLTPPRTIRSFVLRQGRITPSQAKALQEDWITYGIDLPASENADANPLHWQQLFNREAPRILEIGFGMGDVLIAAACAHPEKDFVGVEVHPPGVGRCMALAKAQQLQNLKIFKNDVLTLLPYIPPKSIHEIWIYFPDPWPKKKHQKRRLIQPELLHMLSNVLVCDGLLHLATDWEDYAEHMLTTIESMPQFKNSYGAHNFAPPNLERPKSKFQRRGERLGHGLWELRYRCIV